MGKSKDNSCPYPLATSEGPFVGFKGLRWSFGFPLPTKNRRSPTPKSMGGATGMGEHSLVLGLFGLGQPNHLGVRDGKPKGPSGFRTHPLLHFNLFGFRPL